MVKARRNKPKPSPHHPQSDRPVAGTGPCPEDDPFGPYLSDDDGSGSPVPYWELGWLEDVPRREASWLWPGWIPAGKLTLLDGEKGVGKSALTLDLAARVTWGKAMPDGTAAPRGPVLLCCAADGISDTLLPRLEAAGADRTQVFLGGYWSTPRGDRPMRLPGDLDLLEEKAGRAGVKLLVLDPLLTYLRVDAYNDQLTARCLARLARLAERVGCAVLAVRSWGRGRPGRDWSRGVGGVGIAEAARALLVAAADPVTPGRYVLAAAVCNLAAPPPSLAYRITAADDAGGFACRVVWEGPSPWSADQLAARPPSAEEQEQKRSTRGKLQACTDLLKELLTDGARESRECKAACAEAGFARRTAERAAHDLGVRVEHRRVDGRHVFLWCLDAGEPGESDESPSPRTP
jgi:hypothetical protein